MRPQRNAADNGIDFEDALRILDASMRPQRNAADNNVVRLAKAFG